MGEGNKFGNHKKYNNWDKGEYWGNRLVSKINFWTAMDIDNLVCVISGLSGSILVR